MNERKITTNLDVDTEKLAKKVGKKLRGGEIIELLGDVGAGKTTFVRGLAAGMGSKDAVASPTFTISRIYDGPSLRLYHFDLYRLNEPGIIEYELDEVMKDPSASVVIEWAKISEAQLPKGRVIISFKTLSIDIRELTIQSSPEKDYLFEDIT